MAREAQVIKNEQGSFTEKLVYYLIGFGIAFYLGMLCGSAWTEGCNLSEWFDNFNYFVLEQHHFIVGFTNGTAKFIFVFEAIWTLGYLFYATQIKHPYRGVEHGDAKWGNARQFTKEFSNQNKENLIEVNFGDCKAPKNPIYVNTHNYWIAEGVYINIENDLTSNLNWLIVGPPGTGKSFRVARPLLSMLCGCFLVTDPKGELSQQTGQFFVDNGYEVFIINCESEEGMQNSNHFNPFPYIRNEEDILSLAQILFKATTKPEADNGGDAFFENSAETLLTSILYLMHYTYKKEDQDWYHLVELLESTIVIANPKGGIDNSDENGILNRFERANEAWMSGACDGVKHEENLKGLVDIRKFYNGAQETTSSIVASLDAHCAYMKLDCVKKLLSSDDIRIDETFGYCTKTQRSKTGKYILYIVTSEDKRYYDWIPSMIYSLFFEELYHLTTSDPKLHQSLPEHLTFLMDEFANVTLPDSFVEKLSTMRSRNMSATIIIQNLIQLKRKFPKFDMDKDLLGQMSITQILGGPDPDSCETLSKLFGNMTIHKQTTGLSRGSNGSFSENEDVMEMPLFSPQKMYKMKKNGPCAIVVKGTDPLYESKVQFQRSPLKKLLTRKVPYQVRRGVKEELQKYKSDLSDCEQIPELIVGKNADEFLKKCDEEGIRVIKLSAEDIDAISIMDRNNKHFVGEDPSTKEFWKNVHKTTRQAIMEKIENTLDLDDYIDTEFLTVQRLRNKGFTPQQIHALDQLIHLGSDLDEITRYFGPHMTASEISDFAGRLAAVKKRTMATKKSKEERNYA